jgi:hypothetical protein
VVDTGDLLAALPSKAADELETPFPAGAQDLQNWIGRGLEVAGFVETVFRPR